MVNDLLKICEKKTLIEQGGEDLTHLLQAKGFDKDQVEFITTMYRLGYAACQAEIFKVLETPKEHKPTAIAFIKT